MGSCADVLIASTNMFWQLYPFKCAGEGLGSLLKSVLPGWAGWADRLDWQAAGQPSVTGSSCQRHACATAWGQH